MESPDGYLDKDFWQIAVQRRCSLKQSGVESIADIRKGGPKELVIAASTPSGNTFFLPVSLLPVMAELAERQTEHNRVAVVMDIRERRFVSDFPRVYRSIRSMASDMSCRRWRAVRRLRR